MTDIAFEELQKRCKKLKNKRLLKWFLVFVLLAGIITFTVVNFYIDRPIKKVMPIKKIVKSVKLKPVKPKVVLPKIKKIIQIPIKKKIIKKDSYDTIILKSNIVIPKVKNKQKIKNFVVKKEIKKVLKVQKEQKPTVDIKVTSLKDEQSLVKSNQEHESFDSTLGLAKYYYLHSKYEKAIYFAKKSNHYKPSSFKPWKYYAKSKIKQKKKSEAIEAIKLYLSYFNSDDAVKMLQEIGGKK